MRSINALGRNSINALGKSAAFAAALLLAPGTAQAESMGINLDFAMLIAPTSAHGTAAGITYMLDDSSSVIGSLDLAVTDGLAINSVNGAYRMYQASGKVRPYYQGGLTISNLTDDMGLAVDGGLGVEVMVADWLGLQASTGLAISVMPDFAINTQSSGVSGTVYF